MSSDRIEDIEGESVRRGDGRTEIRLKGLREHAVQTGRNRVVVAGLIFSVVFLVLAVRLADLTVLRSPNPSPMARHTAQSEQQERRADIVDRNGVLLASDLKTASLAADPKIVLDPQRTAASLARIFPELSPPALLKKLSGDSRFVWIKRNLTPRQQHDANALGMPGLQLIREWHRVYPHGPLLSHVIGFTDIDGTGIAGVEKSFDAELAYGGDANPPLQLSLDVRVQHALRNELSQAMATFSAGGAAGVVMDARTGEVLALSSLPDFDPNHPSAAPDASRFNRTSLGVYELGSVFKLFTAAMALDSGVVGMKGGYDASKPIRIARFTIRDDHAKNRWLSVPEIVAYSSNIGAAKMAMDVGADGQRDYLERFGLLRPSSLELPEIGSPLSPTRWRDVNVMTVAYGHGVAVSPLQLSSGIGALVNGGIMMQPTLLKRLPDVPVVGQRVISKRTSDHLRRLMRLVVVEGTGRKADVAGYLVGGKTGTAEKAGRRGYQRSLLLSSFVAAFPMHDPRYVVYVLLDEPNGTKDTFGFASAGWTAAPIAGRVIGRIAPLLNVRPVDADMAEVHAALDISLPKRESKSETF